MTSPNPKRGSARRRIYSNNSLFAVGEHAIWLTSGALIVAFLMIVSLLLYVLYQGGSTFWPGPILKVELNDGTVLAGEYSRSETEPAADGQEPGIRRLIRTGNFDVAGTHFTWVSDADVAKESRPPWLIVVERLAWGRFYGELTAFMIGGERVEETAEGAWSKYLEFHEEVAERREELMHIERVDLGVINHQIEKARLGVKSAEREGEDSAAYRAATEEMSRVEAETGQRLESLRERIRLLRESNQQYGLVFRTAGGEERILKVADIVRAYPPNQMDWMEKLGVYFDRWREFLIEEPREANSEGGVFPAIFGTAIMTLLMSIVVVPFGVLAALYLREYARPGPLVTLVRIAVGNLAGVPSIVFGVFGLGFFCYVVGASLDDLLFSARLPNPTYGKGGLLWASLTLALLTLPVVIVATEEALAAVPSSLREGSYGCGASKWQTIQRIVLPRAMPGILTGMILAMARGAGEVAPLMLVGAVKLAPDLPIDGVAPFIHPERSFMHLGFHIYDLGFQSQNSEAAKPMVFTSTLLLIALIFLMNLSAIALRSRLRRKFVTSQV
jgi:phosphate transport system permease protein